LNTLDTLYNTNLVIGPEGDILLRHRKLMPTYAEKMVWGFGDGSMLRVLDTALGKLGTLICGENANPLARYALIAQGEQVHVSNYPTLPGGDAGGSAATRLRPERKAWSMPSATLRPSSRRKCATTWPGTTADRTF
jgi:nitrilase